MTEKRFMSDITNVFDTWFGYMGENEPTEREIKENDYLLIGIAESQSDAESICEKLNELNDEVIEYCNFSLHDLLYKKNKEIEQLKSRIHDLEWILGIQSDITPVYWGDRKFNCCILDLMNNGRQRSVLNYLYNHYRKNDYEIKDFDNTLREHGVKYGKYGWEKKR